MSAEGYPSAMALEGGAYTQNSACMESSELELVFSKSGIGWNEEKTLVFPDSGIHWIS